MNLNDTAEEAAFRQEVRSWLEKELPRLAWPEPEVLEAKVPFWRQWQRALYDSGYAGLTWPKQYGGQGYDERLRSVFNEECDRAGTPERLNTIGEDFAGLTVAHYGTDSQHERYLEPILRGDAIWCQLFSEPEAGSDLASLRTKATKTEGGWRIDGQKIWTSRAQIATMAILLARTGGGERHRGITYFLLPMDSPGVTVRPLEHMLGEAEFNEVFLDDVFISDDNVVGEVDKGWAVAMGTLGFERVAIATGRVNTTKTVEDLITELRSKTAADGTPVGADPLVRQAVADLWSRALTHRIIGQRVVASTVAGGPPGPVASIGKLYFIPLVDDLADFRLSLEPLGGQVDVETSSPAVRRWLRLANQSRGSGIAGGTTFIQRNIIAERILGMPRT